MVVQLLFVGAGSDAGVLRCPAPSVTLVRNKSLCFWGWLSKGRDSACDARVWGLQAGLGAVAVAWSFEAGLDSTLIAHSAPSRCPSDHTPGQTVKRVNKK